MRIQRFIAAAAGVLCAVSLHAQEGRPEPPAAPEPMSDSLWAATRTQEMAEKYELTAEQEGRVFELNLQYAGKLQVRPERQEGERKDPRSMTEEERQAFFQQMQERRAGMQEQFARMREDRKAYEEALGEILTKEQMKAYRKDRRKQESERQNHRQGPGGRPGGGGFPGGGFGGGGFGGDF